MQATSYQLKYCERCGSLRLRRAASAENYCQPCEQALFNWSLPEETVRLLRQPPARELNNPHPDLALPGRLQ